MLAEPSTYYEPEANRVACTAEILLEADRALSTAKLQPKADMASSTIELPQEADRADLHHTNPAYPKTAHKKICLGLWTKSNQSTREWTTHIVLTPEATSMAHTTELLAEAGGVVF